MKKVIKQNCLISLLACILFACSPTEELINNVDSGTTSVMPPMRRLAGNAGILNAFSFDSIAEADAMLEAMQSVEDAESFYNTYISNSNVNNKYLNSIYEYMCIVESIEAGDSINALLALTENQDSLFNMYIDGGDTIIEPLSCFDYRCLVNEDNVFVVGDRAYHLFDTIFITCPINRHAELVEISKNPFSMQLLLDELKAEKKEIEDTIMIKPRGLFLGFSEDLTVIYFLNTAGTICNNYEKKVGKHKICVGIECYEGYQYRSNMHVLETRYRIKSHKKWLGIWWIKKLNTSIDINYNALYLCGNEYDRFLIPIDSTYSAKQFYHSYSTVISYPYQIQKIINMGPENVDFTITNPHLTITEDDYKSTSTNIDIQR